MSKFLNLDTSVPEADAAVSKDLRYSDYVHAKPTADLGHFPGKFGLPLVGRTFDLIRDMRGMAQEHYTSYGTVSRIQLSTRKGLLVLGPDISRRLFLDNNQEFSARMGYSDSLGYFFPGGLLLKDFDDHRFQRRILQTSFKSNTLRGYVDTLNRIFEEGLGQWNFSNDFHFFPNIKSLLLESSLKVFYGISKENAPIDMLYKAFLDSVRGQMAIVRYNIPGLLFNKGINGRDTLRNYVRNLIPQRRSEEGTSMLDYMCRETREDGSLFSDEEIINHVNFILFAAHDTTTSVLTHLVYYLARHQEWQDKVREEALGAAGANLTADEANSAELLEYTFNEALRLHPSVPMLARRTLKKCTLDGHQIKANTQLFHIPGFNHLMPNYWDNPYNFDPLRFSPERAENKRHPFAFIPFGGGAHKCIGLHFANLQAKLFLHQFITRFKFTLPDGYKEIFSSVPLPKLKDDLPLIVKPVNSD